MATPPAPPQEPQNAAVWAYFEAHPGALPKLAGHSARVLGLAGKIMTVDIGELIALVRADPASIAELLRMANSPRFFRGSKLVALDEAIIRLGRREVYQVLTAVAAQSLFRPKQQQLLALMPSAWYAVQHQAVCCAFTSAWLAHSARLGDYEAAFMLGLFGHIGRLGALFALGTLVRAEALPLPADPIAWLQHQAPVWRRMTPKMLQVWQLDPGLTAQAQAVASPEALPPGAAKVLHGVRLVHGLQQASAGASLPDWAHAQLQASRQALGLAETQLDTVQRQLAEVQDQVTGLLGASG